MLLSAAGSHGLSITVATGPFTTSEDLTYGPLTALLEHCKQQKPDVLLLMGPFVDSEHPWVQAGQLQQTFQELFWTQVSWRGLCPTCVSKHSPLEKPTLAV